MKNNLLKAPAVMLFLLIMGLSSYAQYTIKGKVKGIANGDLVLERRHLDDANWERVDSFRLVNGLFELHGRVKAGQLMRATITPGNWHFNLFVENEQLTIEADTAGAKHYNVKAYVNNRGADLVQVRETGSPMNDE